MSIICAILRSVGIKTGHSKNSTADRGRAARVPACCLVLLLGLFPVAACRSAEVSGRYVMATSASAIRPDSKISSDQEVYGGTVSVSARKNAYEMDWQLAGDYRSLHGLGLLEDRELLGVSISTGGGAYGIAVYRHGKNDAQWKGRWVTSIDGAANVGEITFDAGPTLVGSHPLTCKRPGVGSFVGTVQIEAKGSDYLLTFLLGHAVLYKGLGVLSGDGRLVVGWSFGSTPALAVYRYNSDGLLTGRRLALRANGQVASTGERMAREGEIAARFLPVAAHGDLEQQVEAGPLPGAFGTLTDPVLAVLEPNPPLVKQMTYDQLQKAGPDGWAERWVAGQLSPEERTDLASARQRIADTGRGKGKASPAIAQKTIGELIEQERQRRTGKSSDKPEKKARR